MLQFQARGLTHTGVKTKLLGQIGTNSVVLLPKFLPCSSDLSEPRCTSAI